MQADSLSYLPHVWQVSGPVGAFTVPKPLTSDLWPSPLRQPLQEAPAVAQELWGGEPVVLERDRQARGELLPLMGLFTVGAPDFYFERLELLQHQKY